MAVHVQDAEAGPPRWPSRFYAYCGCGVCGPIRTTREAAEADEEAHAAVCKLDLAVRSVIPAT